MFLVPPLIGLYSKRFKDLKFLTVGGFIFFAAFFGQFPSNVCAPKLMISRQARCSVSGWTLERACGSLSRVLWTGFDRRSDGIDGGGAIWRSTGFYVSR